jgi:hypothetical protein
MASSTPKISYILWVLANNYFQSMQFDIFESASKDIFDLMASNIDPIHPQFIAIFTEYYLKGGKANLEDVFPDLKIILPDVDVQPTEEDQIMLPEKTTADFDFPINFISSTKFVDKKHCCIFLYFHVTILNRRMYFPCFEMLIYSKCEFAKRVAVKCLQLKSSNKFIPSFRLNFKKRLESITKFETSHRSLLDVIDAYLYIEQKVVKGGEGLFSSEQTKKEVNDYMPSYILLSVFKVVSKTGVSDSGTSALISLILNVAIGELKSYVEGAALLSSQTLYALYHVARKLKLSNFEDDLVNMIFLLRTPKSALDIIIQNKLFECMFKNLSSESTREMIVYKFSKKLVFSVDQIGPAREGMKLGWERFKNLIADMKSNLDLDKLLENFDEQSVFYSRHACRPLNARFISLPRSNNFLRDITLQVENPAQEFVNKLSHVFLEQRDQTLGLTDKTTLSFLHSIITRSLRRQYLRDRIRTRNPEIDRC